MKKYMSITHLNSDQLKRIEEKGWCVFTECDDDGTYYHKGLHWVNRVGYIILSQNVEKTDLCTSIDLEKIAKYDEDFEKLVNEELKPIEDKCYVFLVKNPARDSFAQIWTNKGLEEAKKLSNLKFSFPHKYFEKEDYEKMNKIIRTHNQKVEKDTMTAKSLLAQAGFIVVSKEFAVNRK